MSEPIKVGDLVVVVRTCCAARYAESGGIVTRVREIVQSEYYCWDCAEKGTLRALLDISGKYNAAPLFWLKRIPPLDELEGEKRDEEITA